MITVCEIKLKTGSSVAKLSDKIEKRLHIPSGSVESIRIVKESLDAREKPEIYMVYNVQIVKATLSDEDLIKACKKNKVSYSEKVEVVFEPERLTKDLPFRPVIVGFGPCGMFAALTLSKMGAKPIVLERGGCMEERVKAVEGFWNKEPLDFSSNVQFGEGGAGTFSDGKLTTGTKSIYREYILNEFIKMGAKPEIGYQQKPHIGSDVLRNIVVGIRKEIESLGGEVRFHSQFEEVVLNKGKVIGAKLTTGEVIDTKVILLCPGHSARDTVRSLYKEGIAMEQKPFSMGVRIEHPQSLIDISQYGKTHEELGLDPAIYKLNVRTKEGRGVYTFCMCPGGFVVNASSHEGMVVTNGMSNSDRGEKVANSGYLSDVRVEDFESGDVLAGIAFQEKYERLAFEVGGMTYNLPNEPLKSFRTKSSVVKKCLPEFVWDALVEALPLMDKKLKGFNSDDAHIYGIESRSSSPVRILRDEKGYAIGIEGLYPCGEGAGYAGGIMSAASDGVGAAVKVWETYK